MHAVKLDFRNRLKRLSDRLFGIPIQRHEIFLWLFFPAAPVLLFTTSLTLAGASITYTYDDAGRLLSVNYGGGQGISYTYDNAGNLLKRTIVRFQDTDEDFIDDTWEAQFFGSADRDGTGDFDSDGQSDLAEFLSGTDPTDAKSQLRVTGGSTLDESGFTIEWDSTSGKTYQVQYKENLNDPTWFNLGSQIVALGETATRIDPDANTSTNRFYRVIVVP